jgi:hypothetical protein
LRVSQSEKVYGKFQDVKSFRAGKFCRFSDQTTLWQLVNGKRYEVCGARFDIRGIGCKAQGAGFYQEKLEYCKRTLLADFKGNRGQEAKALNVGIFLATY